jgi:hypothetical protein
MEPEGPVCSQEPAIGSYTDPAESNPYPHLILL